MTASLARQSQIVQVLHRREPADADRANQDLALLRNRPADFRHVILKDAPTLQNVLFGYMPHLFVDSLAGQNLYGFDKQVPGFSTTRILSPCAVRRAFRTWSERDGMPGSIDSFYVIKQLR
ncbi:hypothetical protein [Bradyrhizobium sp. USDA 3364]